MRRLPVVLLVVVLLSPTVIDPGSVGATVPIRPGVPPVGGANPVVRCIAQHIDDPAACLSADPGGASSPLCVDTSGRATGDDGCPSLPHVRSRPLQPDCTLAVVQSLADAQTFDGTPPCP